MTQINPNHPVIQNAERNELWYKLLAVVMRKYNLTHIPITAEDVAKCDGMAIVLTDKKEETSLRLVTMAEGERLARKEGGLPV